MELIKLKIELIRKIIDARFIQSEQTQILNKTKEILKQEKSK